MPAALPEFKTTSGEIGFRGFLTDRAPRFGAVAHGLAHRKPVRDPSSRTTRRPKTRPLWAATRGLLRAGEGTHVPSRPRIARPERRIRLRAREKSPTTLFGSSPRILRALSGKSFRMT